ncbi:U3 small nucleolar RNA-associated protein 14 homolog A-like, partial [Photinus pyralis]
MTAGKGQLVKNVLNLNKKVVYPKPSRTEPRREVSEFNLAPSEKGKSNVRVTDLTDALKKQSKQAGVRQRIRSFEKKVKPLPKPLEKVKADRIRRSTAFDKVKKHLNRWNAVVTSNRASNHLTFPLQDDLKLESGKNFTTFRIKSDLQKRLETFEEPGEVFNLESEPKYPLTMQEMLERRKEMKKMKIIESQKAAKARRQNKIKSKKYHRIQRREKIKGQIKEFEGLQQTNPDEALKKLDEIERVRAEERASLRHRNTGKWAKSKQIKAKYDSTNRQELAQQLMISRELTQKVQADDDRSESEDENVPKAPTVNNDNPWVNQIKTSEEVETFLKGYRKFWEEKNATKTEASAVVEADASAVVEAEAMKSNADVAVEEEESNTVVETEVEIVNLAKEDVGASVPEE